jgi:hypothetical protein
MACLYTPELGDKTGIVPEAIVFTVHLYHQQPAQYQRVEHA